MPEWLHFHFSLSCIGKGNGNPLQYSCLENLRDRGACWAASMGLHRVGHNWSNLAAAADSILRNRDITLLKRSIYSRLWFFQWHVWMWELNCEESWVLKNWCFWTVVLEKTLGSPLDCREIQPVHPKWNQSWVFIGRTDVEAETPILWPPDVKWTHGNRPWYWERLKVGGEGDDRG